MSFLNPVNEPVLRFKSTDMGAPQINHNARAIGDVKNVLKACLVTGYGAKASAGWSIENEVGDVCDFVSPSIFMQNYSIGVNDSSASSTIWYYKHMGVRINPINNTLTKSFVSVNKTSEQNGWELLVTEQGFYFVEKIFYSGVNQLQSRVTSFGRVKSALYEDASAHNMGFWSVGHTAPISYPWTFFQSASDNKRHYNINGHITPSLSSSNIGIMAGYSSTLDENLVVEMPSELFLVKDGVLLGQHVGLLLTRLIDLELRFGVYDTVIDGRPVLYTALGVVNPDLNTTTKGMRGLLIYLDNWGY